MGLRLTDVGFDADDPGALAKFWGATLGWDLVTGPGDAVHVRPTDGTSFGLAFRPASEPKTEKNPIHLDLVSESVEDQRAVVDRLFGLGGQHVDIGQTGEERWTVLADPEGNELCILRRGEFTADAPFLASIVFEPGLPATGAFWSEALGWPIVFDEDGDTAIRAGTGPFITFGPDAVGETGPGRLHLEVAPTGDSDQQTEVARLLALGATTAAGEESPEWVVLADPNLTRLRVLPG